MDDGRHHGDPRLPLLLHRRPRQFHRIHHQLVAGHAQTHHQHGLLLQVAVLPRQSLRVDDSLPQPGRDSARRAARPCLADRSVGGILALWAIRPVPDVHTLVLSPPIDANHRPGVGPARRSSDRQSDRWSSRRRWWSSRHRRRRIETRHRIETSLAGRARCADGRGRRLPFVGGALRPHRRRFPRRTRLLANRRRGHPRQCERHRADAGLRLPADVLRLAPRGLVAAGLGAGRDPRQLHQRRENLRRVRRRQGLFFGDILQPT